MQFVFTTKYQGNLQPICSDVNFVRELYNYCIKHAVASLPNISDNEPVNRQKCFEMRSASFEGKESLSINKADGFKIMSLNVFSLLGHLDQLNILIEEEKPHVIGINETKIDSDISDTDIQIGGYEVVRRDRNKWGGGVALYIHKSISANYAVRLDLMHY